MVDKIKVKNVEEFEQLIEEKDLKISKSIVKKILENLVGKRKHIHVLEVYLQDEDSIIDITCDRNVVLPDPLLPVKIVTSPRLTRKLLSSSVF